MSVSQRPLLLLVAVLALMLPGAVPAQVAPSLDEVLQRMRAYIAEYGKHLPAVIATEVYNQRAGSGIRRVLRRLESDYGMVLVPGSTEWIGFREVLKIDGKPVSDSASRLGELIARPSAAALTQARRIAEESARFNIGPIFRTINDPSFVLELLDARNAARLKFSKDGEAKIDGTPVLVLNFQETGRPTIIRTREMKDQPARGRVWVEPATGRVLRAEASVQPGFGAGNFIGTLDVQFAHDDRMGFAVPSKMTERYTNRNMVVVSSGEATYTNFRRFTVDIEENVVVK